VSAAAIESVAENFVDSWLAPLLAYAAFGLAGAYAYRAANTADAMWGYRTPTYEWLGKGSARIDNVLNWVPARLGAAILVLVAKNRHRSLRVWLTDAGRTASPNAARVSRWWLGRCVCDWRSVATTYSTPVRPRHRTRISDEHVGLSDAP
jgi:cobalamin biosynthesis protein CobD/CbiB